MSPAKTTRLGVALSCSPQTGPQEDCAGAVEYWKTAATNYNGLPPAYTKDKAPHDVDKSVPFVALFNPQDKSTVDCAFVTCPTAVDLPVETLAQPQPPAGSATPNGSRSEQLPTKKTICRGKDCLRPVLLGEPKGLVENMAPLRKLQRAMRACLAVLTRDAPATRSCARCGLRILCSEEQGQKIKGAFGNSASTTALSFCGLTAAAVGLAVF